MVSWYIQVMAAPADDSDWLKQEVIREQRVQAAAAQMPVAEVSGVVWPLGPCMGRSQGEDDYRLRFNFVAWRIGTDPVREQELKLCQLPGGRPLRDVMNTIKPLAVLTVAARVLEDNEIGTPYALIVEHRRTTDDPQLEAIAADLRKPVTFADARLGLFTLNRALGKFEGRATRGKELIAVDVAGATVEAAKARMETLASIIARSEEWDRWTEREVLPRVHEQAVNWAEVDPPPTKEDVAKDLHLIGVSLYEDGGLSLLYEAGDHLGGHQAWVVVTPGGDFDYVEFIG